MRPFFCFVKPGLLSLFPLALFE